MKTSIATLAALTAVLSTASAYWKGFNIGANNPDGSCKTEQDWERAFRSMQSLPGHFTSARLFASSDCNTLANAVPAALNTGTQLLVGVWTENTDHYNAEKAALQAAVQAHGTGWIVSVSVGSEDLYRHDTSASTLAGQINEVRNILSGMGAGGVQVGHVDTWTAWVDPANTAVIQACDFVGMDGYPYYQNSDINDAYNVFWKSVQDTRNVVNSVKPGTWVWITESGWPVSGQQMGSAVASQSNAQQYWSQVACSAFAQAHTFWFQLQDYSSNPSFGVIDANSNPIYNLNC
jgi:exo-beta-1,3-glucanase (GH17 family)